MVDRMAGRAGGDGGDQRLLAAGVLHAAGVAEPDAGQSGPLEGDPGPQERPERRGVPGPRGSLRDGDGLVRTTAGDPGVTGSDPPAYRSGGGPWPGGPTV